MKTLQELEKQLANIQKEIESLKQEQVKPEFEKDCWYKHKGSNDFIAKFAKLGFKNYGRLNGCWNNTRIMSNPSDWTKMTEAEIIEALVKEADNRGIKEGVTVDRTGFESLTYPIVKLNKNHLNDWLYFSESDTLEYYGKIIYSNGKWAKVVREEPLMIGGYEVKYNKLRYLAFEIDGKYYSRFELETLKNIMERGQVKSLNVGCNAQYKVDLDFINKMLALK